MINPNKLYETKFVFTNYVKLGVYSTKPLNMQAFGHKRFTLSQPYLSLNSGDHPSLMFHCSLPSTSTWYHIVC